MPASLELTPQLYAALVLGLGVFSQWLAWRLKLPSILILLIVGFSFGQLSGARIDDYLLGGSHTLLSVIGLFVAAILFEGGLTLKFHELREAGPAVLRLCTITVLVSFLLTTTFMTLALGYDIRIGALIGAILTVTGPTVIGPLLQHVNPTRKTASILRWEGIVVDSIGAILAILVFKIVLASTPEAAGVAVILAILRMILVGIIGGYALARAVEFMLHRNMVPEFQQPVFLLAVVALAFTGANLIEQEAGLVTVTILGIFLANQNSVPVRHILEFKENLRTLFISLLFIVLSGRIHAKELYPILGAGFALFAFSVLIVRPASIWGGLLFSKTTTSRERTFLAFVAPRGVVAAAVTSIFAMKMDSAALEGIFGAASQRIAEQAETLTPLVFLLIIGTVALYGTGAKPLAHALGLASKRPSGILFAGGAPWVRRIASELRRDGHRVLMIDTNFANVAAARMEGLEAHRANILSKFTEEELDFIGISTLVAATPNNEVNALAIQRYVFQFGRSGVWQIAPARKDETHRTATPLELRAPYCFEGAPTHERLCKLVERGAVVKKTSITGVYSLDHFRKTHAEREALILFLDSPAKGLHPAPEEIKDLPIGTVIYALMLKSTSAEAQPADN